MASLLIPPCAHLTLCVPQLPPSFPINAPTKPSFAQASSSTAPFKCAPPSTTHLNIVRWTILAISSVCLILDIIAVQLILSRPHLPHGLPFTTPQPDQNSRPSFFSLLVFRLVPDIMVISLMSMLLWKRIQLPSRLWSLHTFCRVLFSTVIMAFALFSPIAELRLALERNQGWAVYACQIRPPQGGSLRIQDNWVQNCAVLRARSVLTVMWVLLFLVEIFIAYRAKEFQSREGNRKHGHWSKARTDRLIKASMDSSSEIWSDEIVRVHNDDHDEIDVDDSNERDNDYDHDNEDTSSQHDLGQQRSSLQEHRYSHPPPEYHYAYRVEVLEPALPPFVYNPFLAHSDCSFACFDTADSVTTASSITISSIGSSDSRPDPYRNQNGEVSEARHHGCM